jgi:hypothetical protein
MTQFEVAFGLSLHNAESSCTEAGLPSWERLKREPKGKRATPVTALYLPKGRRREKMRTVEGCP